MPKKKDKVLDHFRTIYIVTNADKTILSAFTSKEEAQKEIEIKYSILPERFEYLISISFCASSFEVKAERIVLSALVTI